jgi:dephospho-CoA kinase
MILVGLTGCIGSGKSTVSALLANKGARIIDGDKIARELQEPGTSALARLVETFGDILNPDGTLDRARLAGKVFGDAEQLAQLNAIMRPAIRSEIETRIARFRDTDEIVVLDMPLLIENPRNDLAAVIVVDVMPETAIERLVRHRGMSESDVRARLAAQVSRDDRLAAADYVIDNEGPPERLDDHVGRVWEWIQSLPSWTAQSQ